jgi:hypothetical protein
LPTPKSATISSAWEAAGLLYQARTASKSQRRPMKPWRFSRR